MLDGRFLFEFYICHPADWRYNAVNQGYWLQLHNPANITSRHSSGDTHLVRPLETSERYSSHQKLLPFRKWLNISHLDTYIHGPFEFATIRGQKTRDCIRQEDWDVLSKHQSMFSNPLPRFDVPTYSIHVNHGAHVTFQDQALWDAFTFKKTRTFDVETVPCRLWQKVFGAGTISPLIHIHSSTRLGPAISRWT
jgi:hypothetical protein